MALTLDEIHARGWKFKNHSHCGGCGDAIEWWENPQGNTVPPINPMQRGVDEVVFHNETCSELKQIEKDVKERDGKSSGSSKPLQHGKNRSNRRN